MIFSSSTRYFAGILALVTFFAANDASAAFKLIAPPQNPAPAAIAESTQQDPSAPIVIAPAAVESAPTSSVPSMSAPVLPAGSVLDAGRPVEAAMPAPQPLPPMNITPVAAPAATPVAIAIPVAMVVPFKAVPAAPAAPVTDAGMASGISDVPNNVINGFGKNVPLHTALRQIAPQGFEFAFGQGVNPAQSVSWQGGQSWRDVLTSTLKAQGLSFRETASVIYVQSNTPPAKMQNASFSVPAVKAAQPLPPVGTSDFNKPLLKAAQQAKPEKTPTSHLMHKVSDDANGPMVIDSGTPGVVTSTTQTTQQTQTVTQQPAPPAPAVVAAAPPVPPAPVAAEAPAPAVAPAPVALPPVQAPAAPAAVAAPADATNSAPIVSPVVQSWDAKSGTTLHTILQQWCNQVGAELTWDAEYDYPIQAPIHVDGTFDDAVRSLLKGFQTANPPPKGQIYTGQGKQAILVVTAPGNDYTN